MKINLVFFIFLLFFTPAIHAQVVINEVLSSNLSGINDEDGDFTDWIELYNVGDTAINLDEWVLKDDLNDSVGWSFPFLEINSHSHLLVYASGKDRKNVETNYQTIVDVGDEWSYIVPTSGMSLGNWRLLGFDDSSWKKGRSGFGYGDNDDETIIQPLGSIFIRRSFEINSVTSVQKILLHIDYDDGFVAYINGHVVASENVQLTSNSNLSEYEGNGALHEATMYSGGEPQLYEVDLNTISLNEGENVIAIEGYNASQGSSDFTLIPFLTVASFEFTENNYADFIDVGEGGLHTNFKIDKDGESIYLMKPDGEISDSIFVVELSDDVSYGRHEDGFDQWFYYLEPTPKSINQNPQVEIIKDSIEFSPTGGLFNDEIEVVLSDLSEIDGVIHYTINGSTPTLESPIYSVPISVTQPTSIRAIVFIDSLAVSDVFCHSYIVGKMHEIPVLSLTTDSVHLFDFNEGIFELGPNAESENPNFGANFWMDWERPINVEYFDGNGIQQLNQMAGVKVSGNWSRANDQKSIALYARKKYGKGAFNYALFKDREINKYESLICRNSGNDFNATHIRDGLVSEIAKDLDIDRLAYQPVAAYINGVYWGILNMREKPNEHYFESHYDVEEDELNLVGIERSAVYGSENDYSELTSFLSANSTLNDESYVKASKMLDIQSFIDYQLLQIYICNTDWPGNNIKFWSTVNPHSQIRSLLYDTDFGLGLYNSYVDHETLDFATNPSGDGWPNPSWSTLLLRRMLSYEPFRNDFINRFADLMNVDLNKEHLLSKYDSIVSYVSSEMVDHQKRWGRSDWFWTDRLESVHYFISNRANPLKRHFKDYFEINNIGNINLTVSNSEYGSVKISTIIPEEFPFKGYYFSSIPIPIEARPKPGYRFVRWEGYTDDVSPSITVSVKNSIKLHAIFEEAGNEAFDVVINEINYRSADEYDAEDWLEIYNAGPQTINLQGWIVAGETRENDYVFEETILLYPNHYLVVCRDREKFMAVYPKVDNIVGDLRRSLSRKGDVIKLYDDRNNLVDEVIYETVLPWVEEPFSTAATLELIDPALDNSNYENWIAGPLGGTPGAKNGIETLVNVVEDHYLSNVSCFPTVFSNYTTLQFNSNGSGSYRIVILDIQGNIKNVINNDFQNTSTHYLDIFTNGSNYPKGMYLVNVQTLTYTETIRVIKH